MKENEKDSYTLFENFEFIFNYVNLEDLNTEKILIELFFEGKNVELGDK